MNAKRILTALVLCCAACLAVAAAEADVPVISIENGFSIGYDISASDVGSAFEFTLGVGVTDKIQAQVTFLKGDGAIYDDYRLLGLSYLVMPKLGVTTLFGQNTTATVAGVGLYSNIFERSVGGLTTALKLKLDYLANVADYSDGLFRFGLVAVVGM
jgi:hypothetical protein